MRIYSWNSVDMYSFFYMNTNFIQPDMVYRQRIQYICNSSEAGENGIIFQPFAASI